MSTDSGTDFNTLNPFGTFGTGYDVGTYGQTPRQDDPTGGGGSLSGSSAVFGIGEAPPPAETLPVPAAIPQFSYKVKASGRVDFTNLSLNAVKYVWTFDYASSGVPSSSEKDPIRFFKAFGIFNVTLKAYNSAGDYVEKSIQIEVEDLVPDCDFTYVQSGTIVRFTDTSINIDSDVNYWSFGDIEFSRGENPHHTYSGNGIYTVKLQKGSFSKTQIITIDAEVILECDAVSGASGYKWERSPDGVSNWVEFADTAVESVGVTEAVHGVDSTAVNYFRVKAYNGAGESEYSNTTNVRCS